LAGGGFGTDFRIGHKGLCQLSKTKVPVNIISDIMKTKHNAFLIASLCILFTLALTGCKKDVEVNILEKSYFTVQGGTFKDSEIPVTSGSQSSPVIVSINGNPSILEGGSNPISVITQSGAKKVIVGVEGVKGYYSVPVLNPSNTTILLILLFSQELEQDSFVIVVAISDSQELVSIHKTIHVTKIEAGTGQLQVSCSWDQRNDVDLHLVEPNGEEVYYATDISANGGVLDVDSNPNCSIDGINNENITYDDDAIIESGKYTVRVDFFANCYVSSNTNFIVSARYNGNLVTATSGSNPYVGYFVPGEADRGGSGDGRQIMTFNISATKSEVPAEMKLKFVYPKTLVDKGSKKGSDPGF
jgi:hypothetical protein